MPRGLTKIRREVLKIIGSSEKPLTAESIHRAMAKRADLSSVYRALNWLRENGYVESISIGSSSSRYFFPKGEHYHLFVCKICGKMKAIPECFLEGMIHLLEEHHGFTVSEHVLYLEGVCEECKSKRRV